MKLKQFKHKIYKKEGIKLFISDCITIIEISKKTKLVILNTPDSIACKKFNTILESTGNTQIVFLHRVQYDYLIDALTFNKKITNYGIFSYTLHNMLSENKKLMKILQSDKPYLPKEKSKKVKNDDILKHIDDLTTKLDALLNAGTIKVSNTSNDTTKPSKRTTKSSASKKTTKSSTSKKTTRSASKNSAKSEKSLEIAADNTYYSPNYTGTDTMEMDYLKDATDNM